MPLLPPGVNEHFPADPHSGEIDTAALTPLFRQYVELKQSQPGGLLFYRLGDFYETFGPDAVRAAEILGLTLTARACGNDYKVAMAGVPHHSSARYIKRLVEAGEIVALCEQMEDPAQAKGLVARAITRVITAGTLVEDEYLSADSSNFLCVIAGAPGPLRPGQPAGQGQYGIALLESSGGRVDCYELDGGYRALLESALLKRPAELLLPAPLRRDPLFAAALTEALGASGPAIHTYEKAATGAEAQEFLKRFLGATTLAQYGLAGLSQAQAALFALARYLEETFRGGRLRLYPRHTPPGETLYLDRRAAEHLDLLGEDGPGGLYALLNNCRSSLGRRELKRSLLSPSALRGQIEARHDAVELLLEDAALSQALSDTLDGVQDAERIAMRIGLARSNPRELRALTDSLPCLDNLRELLAAGGTALLRELAAGIQDFGALFIALNSLLGPEPPLKFADGGTIREGADSEVDRLRELAGGSQEWFRSYEARQREATGIRTLKVKQTEAFGWFIEVSKGSLDLVPASYTRRQTLVNAERFTTPELSAREAESRSAEARLSARERELYESLCEQVNAQAEAICRACRCAAQADVLLALALTAEELGWTRPSLSAGSLLLEGARHPLVEASVGSRYYTPNDCVLSSDERQLLLLTGPNMGGKSTYLRMVAQLCVLCQLGSFVPAARAELPVLQRIYTRVGAQDRIGAGQSTFMVEMLETAEILNTCGPGSLVILDEVGRGTSTYDGISIAKAVLEYLHEHAARPLTLFATHFFELTDLALLLPRLHNCQVEVARTQDPDTGEPRYSFLYRVSSGAASDSYGIEVAALAGLPAPVVERARQILAQLEEAQREARLRAQKAVQLGLFG